MELNVFDRKGHSVSGYIRILKSGKEIWIRPYKRKSHKYRRWRKRRDKKNLGKKSPAGLPRKPIKYGYENAKDYHSILDYIH